MDVVGNWPLAASSAADYRTWIERHEAPLSRSSGECARILRELRHRPLVSVVVRGAGDPAATLAMLTAQIYPDWELVPALDQAAGTFVGLLDEGAVLAPDALLETIALLAAEPEADIVYADDDLLDDLRDTGHGAGRASPCFRTGWDPDLLLAGGTFGGLTLYRRTLLDRIGAAGRDRDAYALALAAARATTPDRIHHVARVLSHLSRRTQASARTVATVQAHLDAVSPGAIASLCGGRRHRIEWPVPDPVPLVSVIVPTRDRADLLGHCADGVLRRTAYAAIELLLIDNESTDPDAVALLDRLARDPRCRVIHAPGAFDHSSMNNRGVREARGEVLVLLNNDVEIVDPDWLRELVSQARRPDVGAVGAKLLTPGGRLQHGGVTFAPGPIARHVLDGAAADDPGWNDQLAVTREYSAVTAACLAIRRDVWVEVGGFDAAAFPTSYNDVDLCFRIGAHGYRVIWTPFATLIHHGSASRPRLVTDEAVAADGTDLHRLWRRWSREIETDPFSHPALRLFDGADVLLVDPARRNR